MKDSIKRYVGKTPLVRAENLEERLGISNIYIKLEGNNPSGFLEDRLAYLIIRDALEKGKEVICAGKSERIMMSLGYLSELFNIRCVFYVPNKNTLVKKLIDNNKIRIILFGSTRQECINESNRVSKKNGWYNANIQNENNVIYNYTYAHLAKELKNQLGRKIDSVFCQTGRGVSIIGLHWGYKQLWIDEEIDSLPRLFACSMGVDNPLVEYFTYEYKKDRNLYTYQQLETIDKVKDTRGKVIGVKNNELIYYLKEFQKLEKIRLSVSNALPIAAFFKAAKEGIINDGNHIIILKDGKIDLDIFEITLDNLPIPYDNIVALIHEWLIEYRDPKRGIKEGLDEAFKSGYVLCASQKGNLIGICVVVNTGFEVFLPKYHLGYIATKKDITGRGTGTQLLKKAVDLTKGQISLHVDISNENATKLYEKIGFKKKYFRMIYEGIHK